MYARSSTANPYGFRPWNSRLQGLGAVRRRRSLGHLGDANSDYWNAYHTRQTLGAQLATLSAQMTSLNAQLTPLYNQVMTMQLTDPNRNAVLSTYTPLRDQYASLGAQRNALLAQYSATDWILTATAPGADPTVVAVAPATSSSSNTAIQPQTGLPITYGGPVATSPAGQPIATPPPTASNPPVNAPAVAPSAGTSLVPAVPSWIPAPLASTVNLPILGDVPVIYIVGAAAAALLAFGMSEHRGRGL